MTITDCLQRHLFIVPLLSVPKIIFVFWAFLIFSGIVASCLIVFSIYGLELLESDRFIDKCFRLIVDSV